MVKQIIFSVDADQNELLKCVCNLCVIGIISFLVKKLSCEDVFIERSLMKNNLSNSYLPGWEVNRDH